MVVDLPLRISSLQAQKIKVIVVANECVLDDGVQRVDNVLPDRLTSQVTVGLVSVVLDDHPALRRRHACRFPGKPFCADDCPV